MWERGRGGEGIPKIADFGLALALEGRENLTQSGVIVGTPAFMAPEQARGQRALVGPATDVHALGVTLYVLLTGRQPFAGDDPMRVLNEVTSTEPVPPSRLLRRVPADLSAVCMKCLEKEPAGRYKSAAELADDLRRFLADEPVRARMPGPAARAARPWPCCW